MSDERIPNHREPTVLDGILADLEGTLDGMLSEPYPPEAHEHLIAIRDDIRAARAGASITRDAALYALLKAQEWTVLRRLGLRIIFPSPIPRSQA